VDRASLAYLLRQASMLPPHRLLAKVGGFARRKARAAWQRRSDFIRGSHSPLKHGLRWCSRLSIGAQDIAPDLREPLRLLGDSYRRHCFDLLGSGWVEVRYGMSCHGFVGHKFPPHPAVVTDRNGKWLAAQVNASNLAASQGLWRRIGDDTYQPIDWQLDVRSGYRWAANAHFSSLAIPADTGADVKVPWELGRLQHLPQLALCAILAASGAAAFAPAATYLRELRCQLLDFLTLNPPRFGVNWMCPMDVAIRVANIVLAMDFVIGAGLDPERELIDQEFIDIVLRSVRDHADHIVEHPEWSERGCGNHYLANLVGLVWAASHLASDRRTDAMLAFAATELLREGDRQFGADGGNYEGSTNYHRLSSEIVLFGVALLSGLSDSDLARIDDAHADALPDRTPWRGGPLPRHALPDGCATILPPDLREKLYRAAQMMRACTGPDGRVVQVGDTDCGRLFKITPTGRRDDAADQPKFYEDALDHRAAVAGIEALFAIADDARTLDSAVVWHLAGKPSYPLPTAMEVADHGDLEAVIRSIEALPTDCQRRRHIPFSTPVAITAWRRAAFPGFGHYGFATEDAFVAFRCAPPPPPEAPLGHTHDDNLAIEYVLDVSRRIDPGSFCYTPSRKLRNRYRGAGAHDVPRAVDWDVAAPGSAVFALDHQAWAQCLAFGATGVAGRLAAPSGTLLRALRLTETGFEIWDGVHPPDRLRPIAPPIEVATGYGRIALNSIDAQ
jgi:hypothetical protein